jgi:hypothetical protein
MSEVDIWIKVLEKIGYNFIDEICGPDDTNYLNYLFNGVYYRLYFNRKKETVNSFFDNISIINKQKFYSDNINIFRDIKLESII